MQREHSAALEIRLNVAEKQQSRLFRFSRDLGLKVCEDVQVRVERVGGVQVVIVTTSPAKRFAVFDALEIVRADAATLKHFAVVEVAANHTDDTYICKKACGDGEMRSRTAKHLLAFTKRGFNGVVCNRSDN